MLCRRYTVFVVIDRCLIIASPNLCVKLLICPFKEILGVLRYLLNVTDSCYSPLNKSSCDKLCLILC